VRKREKTARTGKNRYLNCGEIETDADFNEMVQWSLISFTADTVEDDFVPSMLFETSTDQVGFYFIS